MFGPRVATHEKVTVMATLQANAAIDDVAQSKELSAASVIDELRHDFRNGLSGTHAAIRLVRDAMSEGWERDILTAAISRIERLNRQVDKLR